MYQGYFFHNLIRKYVIGFAHLFTDIYVQREDPYSPTPKSIRVPLSNGHKLKTYIQNRQDDPAVLKSTSVLLPRMTFEITGISIDDTVKTNQLEDIRWIADDGSGQTVYSPTPILMNFSLSIWTKYQSDAYQILEQIIPYFHTYHSVGFKYRLPQFPEGQEYTCTVTMDDIGQAYEYDLTNSTDSINVLRWDLSFSFSGLLFGPIENRNRITHVLTKVFSEMDAGTFTSQIEEEVYPDTVLTPSEPWGIKETITDEHGVKSINIYEDNDNPRFD